MTISFRRYPFAGLFALALAAPLATPGMAQAPSTKSQRQIFQTPSNRVVGPQRDGSIVASDNQLLTPAGKLVYLGSPVVAKAVALNPKRRTHSAAVLLMAAAQPVIVFDTKTGAIVQRYVPTMLDGTKPTANSKGSFTGIAYSADGSKLLFSQDNNFVAVANVDPFTGQLSPAMSVPLPSPPANPDLFNSVSANAGGVVVADGSLGLVALNANNTVGVINLFNSTLVSQIPVGNAPNSIAVKGRYAYVSNEGGRPAKASDFTNLSDGTPIVADPTDAFATTGTVSVIDLRSGTVTNTINVGLHPAGMTVSHGMLYVANSYSDTISVIDTGIQKVVRTIKIGVPVKGGAFGAGTNGIAVAGTTAYVSLGQSNAVAVVDLTTDSANAVLGYIPTAYFPTSIAYDKANNQIVVCNDKGIDAQGSIGKAEGVSGYNTHQESGAISLIPVPSRSELAKMTKQVIKNNHWNSADIQVGPAYANPNATPVAIPAHIGEPSLIKHVFLIIKENRTYDQMLGDVAQGNGDPSLAVFASAVPNQHALISRFPLLDNIYAPSRQSADGHPWIVESGSFYSNDILSPDWIRSYPGGNSNDALTYTQKGFLWSGAEKKGLDVKMYGEWSGGYTISPRTDGVKGPFTWADWYNTSLYKETGGKQGKNIVPDDSDTESATIPSVTKILDPHYPSFNLDIPDQYRADYYIPILKAQDAAGKVPNLTIIWLPDDHTDGTSSGHPLPINYQADNDLALGRMVDAISHTKAWPSTAIFVEEDDSQDGVDHVDGHRMPAYIISPYATAPQSTGVGKVIDTTYTQENINRTIENILGLAPLTQFDLTVSPMFDCFQNTPDDAPYTFVPATVPLNIGPGGTPVAGTGDVNYALNMMPRMTPMQKAWNVASNLMTKGKTGKADSVDENFLNHAIWYSATDWKRPYPGDAKIKSPAGFIAAAAHDKSTDTDD